MPSTPWIVSQIGSREHYAIPAILAENQQLDLLLTDYWSRPWQLWERIPKPRFRKLRQRNHPAIDDKKVIAQSLGRIRFDLQSKSRGDSTWEQTRKRNLWYQQKQLKQLRYLDSHGFFAKRRGIFFSYSYATRELFQFFKQREWKTVLCQIDPGKHEEDLVRREVEQYPQFAENWEPAPAAYWEDWLDELNLADKILVNSPWSQSALQSQGVPAEKIHILPLAFKEHANRAPTREYPASFSKDCPLRLLFLGQVNLRKGVHYLLEALKAAPELPLQVDFVGPMEMDLPHIDDSRLHFHGPVSRQETEAFYQNAHAFILPTLSDGFAITQLEAQGWGLPLIVSKNCGAVVRHGINGLLLHEISSQAIEKALKHCILHPEQLSEWSLNSKVPSDFTLSQLRVNLNELESFLGFAS